MNIKLVQITNPDDSVIDLITDWTYQWWGKEEGVTIEKMKYIHQHSVCAGRLPQTFVLYADGRPAGMFQLSMVDADIRPDIYPWLRNVYIDKPFRGKGLSSLSIHSAMEKAQKLGIKELYLFTEHTGLYERYGWEFAECFQTFLPKKTQRLYCLYLCSDRSAPDFSDNQTILIDSRKEV